MCLPKYLSTFRVFTANFVHGSDLNREGGGQGWETLAFRRASGCALRGRAAPAVRAAVRAPRSGHPLRCSPPAAARALRWLMHYYGEGLCPSLLFGVRSGPSRGARTAAALRVGVAGVFVRAAAFRCARFFPSCGASLRAFPACGWQQLAGAGRAVQIPGFCDSIGARCTNFGFLRLVCSLRRALLRSFSCSLP